MSLASVLEEYASGSAKRVPPELAAIMRKAADELVEKGVGKGAPKIGDQLPNATLTDAKGEQVEISSLLANGPLIVNFYRGGWCPYCNFELKAYQDLLPEIQSLGAQLVAISPQKPDNSLSTQQKNDLTYPVLTDHSNKFAEAIGIVFELPDELQNLYKKIGIDLPAFNSESDWKLPIPATFVVAASGRIELADVDLNYTRRLEPSLAIKALQASLAVE